ncbi:hypothetical protein BV25DRAFT_1785027, partial [Artomyces pyxidatus]
RRVEDELAAIEMALCYSRARRNAIAPISRLPSEVVVVVFAFLSLELQTWKDNLGWITVPHVCRRWRDIALNAATLWREISLALGAEWTSTSLVRARDTPIII